MLAVSIRTTTRLRTCSSDSSGETTNLSDSESESSSATANATIDLTLERLQSLHASGSINKRDLTTYAKRGISTKRIKSAVLRPRCDCACKMPVKLLYSICVAFWTLAKPSQDSLLWSIQNESGDSRKKNGTLEEQLGDQNICCFVSATHPKKKYLLVAGVRGDTSFMACRISLMSRRMGPLPRCR